MDEFFALYPAYAYSRAAHPTSEYRRLREAYGFADRPNPRSLHARRFRDALVAEFNNMFGGSTDSLQNWHDLLEEVGVDERPTSKKACRKILAKTHVNLVDLMHARRTGGEVMVWHSLEQMRAYTNETGKYFPRGSARAGGVLRCLLRHM